MNGIKKHNTGNEPVLCLKNEKLITKSLKVGFVLQFFTFRANLELVWSFSAPVGRSLIEITPPDQLRIRSSFSFFTYIEAEGCRPYRLRYHCFQLTETGPSDGTGIAGALVGVASLDGVSAGTSDGVSCGGASVGTPSLLESPPEPSVACAGSQAL